ncbi:MAG: pentapeptide repeat-containing protein, partial [Merismopedia sp. SIO2A8]|nr:pentapeptide repeat-containing protein [Merismopedia sp. SIO2A8]
ANLQGAALSGANLKGAYLTGDSSRIGCLKFTIRKSRERVTGSGVWDHGDRPSQLDADLDESTGAIAQDRGPI